MNVVLISTYDLGHQPFGLASPARWLQDAGARVKMVDLAVRPFPPATIARAGLIAFYLPMHTATRLALPVIRRARQLNPGAHLCAYGLYAPLNADFLRRQGIDTILGGEYEQPLVTLVGQLALEKSIDLPPINLARQQFRQPLREGLPGFTEYAHVQVGAETRVAGYTVASRGCKYTCRHCPIVPVYNGRFRIVQRDVVLADIRQQVAAGAQHITFGDPDFLNGPGHALPLVQALHDEFPELTYDVTIKVEHLRKYAEHLPVLRDTGCLFVTSAVEAVDDHILEILQKGHTQAEFQQVTAVMREIGLPLNPTFVTFTPWTNRHGYAKLLATLDNLGLVDHVSPVQYAIRLLIPAGSKLLDLLDVRKLIKPFDKEALVYPWDHPQPQMDELYKQVYALVKNHIKQGETRRMLFERVWRAAVASLDPDEVPHRDRIDSALVVPVLSEDWY